MLYRDELVMGGWSAIGNRQSQITNRKSQIPMLYRDAGVDIDAATEAKAAIKQLARKTFNARVLKDVGAFGGFFSIKGLPRDAGLIFSLVPTPSMLEISTASRGRPLIEKNPPKAPTSFSTRALKVLRANCLMAALASVAASMSTPASR